MKPLTDAAFAPVKMFWLSSLEAAEKISLQCENFGPPGSSDTYAKHKRWLSCCNKKRKIHKAEWSVCGFYQRAKEEWVTVEWVTQIFFSRVSLSSFQLHISLLISVCTFFLTPLKQSDRWVEDYWQGKGQRPLLWRNHSDWQIIIRSREHSLPEIPLNSLHFLMLFIQVSFWYEDSSHLIFFGIDDNGIYIFFAWKLDQNSSINPQKWQIQNSKPPFHLLIGRSMFEFGTRRGLLYLLLFPAPSS